MSNASQLNGAQGNIDFSRPPPGYPAQGQASMGAYGTSLPIHNTNTNYLTSQKPDASPSVVPARSSSSNARIGYFQGTGISSNQPPPSRPIQTQSEPPYMASSLVPGPVQEPRVFTAPYIRPPPPPINSSVYTASPAGVNFNVPPPPFMGAGQYVTQKPGHFRPQQYQGEYGTGFAKRGGYNNQLNRKRLLLQEFETDPHKKATKKKKKPLSQNMPSRKDWTLQDAQKAFDIEREYNKRHKSPSLIIKFPDLELNRDIVSKFHSAIESVHFQQPSTPRFCFVTLNDSACTQDVIKDLCRIKFGDGYLSAEPKNIKEEDSVKGPEDIDPLTLYVGNLAQEVTVDDVFKTYPKNRRIDIGFAKKMKYTRYAFVCFHTADAAIEAFQRTYATEMYNKSLIVRFRRLHGTVGLPGDPKPQNTRKRNESEANESASSAYESRSTSMSSDTVSSLDRFIRDDDSFGLYSDVPRTRRPLHKIKREYDLLSIKEEPADDGEQDQDGISEERPHVPLMDVKSEPQEVLPIIVKEEAPEESNMFGFNDDFLGTYCTSSGDESESISGSHQGPDGTDSYQ